MVKGLYRRAIILLGMALLVALALNSVQAADSDTVMEAQTNGGYTTLTVVDEDSGAVVEALTYQGSSPTEYLPNTRPPDYFVGNRAYCVNGVLYTPSGQTKAFKSGQCPEGLELP